MEHFISGMAWQEPLSFAVSGKADPEAGTHRGHPQHVLLVDDDPAIRELVSAYLERNDLRVTTVADGAAMRAALGKQVIDLVVLDLKLGAESGLELARKLRDESAIPIVMLSGQTEEADRVMALELGADDYVTKPFSPRELLARVRAILRRRRMDVRQQRVQGMRAYRFGLGSSTSIRGSSSRPKAAVPCSRTQSSACLSRCSVPAVAPSAARNCSSSRGCTTTRSTTGRWTCSSCGCAASSATTAQIRAAS